MNTPEPRTGQVIELGPDASPQFTHPIRIRVQQVIASGYHDWRWLTGYQLDTHGNAVERRELFVRLTGLHVLDTPVRPTAARRPPASTREQR